MSHADPKSSSLQEQQQTVQTVQYSQHFEDDSIDLYVLWLTLWKRKWIIFAVTVIAAFGSIVYAFQLPHIYKAEALLLPPKSKDIYIVNLAGLTDSVVKDGRFNLTGSPSSVVFRKFKQNINSRTLHKKFIQESGMMNLIHPEQNPETRDENTYHEFAEMIKFSDEDGITSLSIEMHDAEIAAKWINDLIEFFDKETISILVEDLRNAISNQIKDIEYKIASKRQMAKKRREDTIARYQEAAFIAQKLGVMDRVDSTNIVQNNQLNITTSNIPLYFRGYRALTTEIKSLFSRESDDPFIGGLRDLQENLTLLKSIKFEKENMRAVQIDQAAYPPKNPIKPNRRLIVSLATVVGLFSGIFLAFFIEFVENKRKKHLE